MILSMTGYGKCSCTIEDKKFVVEIKSLNSKQLELSLKIPTDFRENEMELRNKITNALERGKVEISIREESQTNEAENRLDKQAIITTVTQLRELCKELNSNLTEQEILSIAMHRIPDITTGSSTIIWNDQQRNLFSKSFEEAIQNLISFRKQEGTALAKDISQRVNYILNLLTEIEPHEKKRLEYTRARIKHNLENFISELNLDQSRLEQEMVYYIEKLDITEEKVRLNNHCNYFLKIMNEEPNPGKKLGFVAQEMGREINTIGSKANDTEIQIRVVNMKDELEKIKEQLNNIL